MTNDSSDSFFHASHLDWAEHALKTLTQRVSSYTDRQTRLKEFCRNWQENWLNQSDQIRTQMEELKGRLAPWVGYDETPQFGIVSPIDDAA
ncbi:MAG: hypothetical protein FJ267_19940 [Planctomycetes bacterium]|nr:hypothetical protein [Planctomycetota bacterium]